jgi:hypothetical protein
MDKVTNHQLRAIAGRISVLAIRAGILEGDRWVDGIPDHLIDTRYEFPHLQLDMGSATYGRAYRLNGSGGSVYRTAHYDPMRLGSGYLGNTKREAYLALRAIEAGLYAADKAGN